MSIQRELSAGELIAERMRQDPKVQKIVADAHLFDDLRRDRGWQRLYEVVVKDKQRVTNDIAERLMSGKKVTEEEIAYYRGFYQGAVYVLEHPEKAEANLERAARVAWMLAQELTEQEVEADSPYITGPTKE